VAIEKLERILTRGFWTAWPTLHSLRCKMVLLATISICEREALTNCSKHRGVSSALLLCPRTPDIWLKASDSPDWHMHIKRLYHKSGKLSGPIKHKEASSRESPSKHQTFGKVSAPKFCDSKYTN
jgi:hypothetical protein